MKKLRALSLASATLEIEYATQFFYGDVDEDDDDDVSDHYDYDDDYDGDYDGNEDDCDDVKDHYDYDGFNSTPKGKFLDTGKVLPIG